MAAFGTHRSGCSHFYYPRDSIPFNISINI
jgi:hypothetical protein